MRSTPTASINSKQRIVAAYDYTDEAGVLLYQTVRYEPKDFNQRRPDGSGGWTWSLGDVRLVPYRLPLIVARHAQPVVIVEGEEDVHALEKLGLLATTNPMGAGKWRVDYSFLLRGRRCVVLPDDDEAGHRHAEHVLGSLICHGAASVRVMRLPGAKDARDWLKDRDGKYTAAKKELVELIRQAANWQPT